MPNRSPHKLNNHFMKNLGILLKAVLTFNSPTDKLITEFFKTNHKLNHFERKLVGDTIYSLLRHYHKTTAAIANQHTAHNDSQMSTSWNLIGLCWVQFLKLEQALYADINLVDFTELGSLELGNDVPSQTEFPGWLLDKLAPYFSQTEIVQLAQAMNQRAPLDLRVNLLKNNRKNIEQILQQENIAYTLCPFSPLGIRLVTNTITPKYHLLTSGEVEIQDESSQLACQLLMPKQNSMVVDFCAGSGGKALTCGMLMKNTGRIYALDSNENRLNKLQPRLLKSGLTNIYPQLISHENDNKLERLQNKMDYVFVDAPCSGLGTLRRNPELKLRQNPESITKLTAKQLAILTAASKLVKAGGQIVYATCSILYEENQAIVAAFLEAHPNFKLIPAKTALAKIPTLADITSDYLILLPHIHNTDGFFAALLQRT